MKCIQTKPGDADCTAGARTKCEAELAKITGEEAKLHVVLQKKCGTSLAFTDVASGSGLGYDDVAAECESEHNTPIAGLDDVTACIAAQHRCVSAQIRDVEAARARELMTFAGVSLESLAPLSCLPDHGGIGANVNDPEGTGAAIAKCTATVQKAGATFVKKKLASLSKCVNAVFRCRQLDPGDSECLGKASETCDKAFVTIQIAADKLGPAVDKKCAAAEIAYASLRIAEAANLDALAAECAAYGVPTLDSIADYEECLFRQHECRVEDLLRFEAPRAEEMLDLVGRDLRSAFCPLPPG